MTTKSQADVFVATIVRPALHHIALPSEAAEQLLLGTALVESRLVKTKTSRDRALSGWRTP